MGSSNDFLGLGTLYIKEEPIGTTTGTFTFTGSQSEPPKIYATIKEVEKKLGRRIRWEPLNKFSKDHEIEFIYIQRENDTTYIKAYHADAWYGCYEINIINLFD